MLLKDPGALVPLTLLLHLTACSNLTLKLVITQQLASDPLRPRCVQSGIGIGIGMVMGSPSLHTTGCYVLQAAP